MAAAFSNLDPGEPNRLRCRGVIIECGAVPLKRSSMTHASRDADSLCRAKSR